MGIQINGATDTISATDGGLAVSGQQLTGVTDINASGIVTATQGYVVGTGASVFSPAANTLALGTNGSERVRVSSAGSFGIGQSAPDERLHITGATSSNTTVKVQSTASAAERSSIEFFNNAISRGRIGGANDFDGLTIDSSSTESAAVIRFRTGGGTLTEKARIDSSGRLLLGASSSSANTRLVVQGRTVTDVNGQGVINIQRGQTGPGNITEGFGLGEIFFTDSSANVAAAIYGVSDGTWGAGGSDYPGRLVFATTSDGASSPTERARVINSGYWKFSNSGSYEDSAATSTCHYLQNNGSNSSVFIATAWNNSYATVLQQNSCLRAANSAYSFFKGVSGNGSTSFADNEFDLRGDGTGLCDGSWTGGGADYAEYFEWSDYNPTAEDRRGVSVVLDGDKIREAQSGEDPIGVISGNPSVVGDSAWNKWSGKYLRDDFGSYIQEDYEVTDEDGNTDIQQRRKLNPEYDPDVEYISREDRPEWDCVGLMGKLRIRKGQVTGSRWIKMRDISDSVEEWLVR